MINLEQMGQTARSTGRILARTSTEAKNAALFAIAEALEANSERLLDANTQDLDEARANGAEAWLLDRLSLVGRISGIANSVRKVARLVDPVGVTFDQTVLPNGLKVNKRRVPLGVLGVIYEARPNVTVDIAALALKTGNAAILRGGSETIRSNIALVEVIRAALESCDLPADAVQLIAATDRAYVMQLLKLHKYVDMIIPRGGAALHHFCRENSTIPVITGGIGICHLYVDSSADLDAALKVIHNAKTQRPSVCNALDTILVNAEIASSFIPRVIDYLGHDGVTFRLDPRAFALASPDDRVQAAGPNDWDTEWLSLILGIRVVDGLEEAIDHIQAHSTAHSDGILTRTDANATRFVDEVDSAVVYVNASTRFTDGEELGLGAEVAVSTQKMHARGPMGLEALTTYKWIVVGENTVRA